MTKRFYDDLDGKCKPINNEFRSQYERLNWKELALSVVSFIAGALVIVLSAAAVLILTSK